MVLVIRLRRGFGYKCDFSDQNYLLDNERLTKLRRLYNQHCLKLKFSCPSPSPQIFRFANPPFQFLIVNLKDNNIISWEAQSNPSEALGYKI
jgi:hypothetical protein